MSGTRLSNWPTTTTTTAADDYLGLDGPTENSRRILADSLKTDFATDYVAGPTTFKLVPLNGSNKIDATYLPASGDTPKGDWLANNTAPVLSDGTGTAGDYYDVTDSNSGTIADGAGTLAIDGDSVAVGDRIKYDGANWYIVPQVANVLDGDATAAAGRTTLDILSKGEVNDRVNARQPVKGVWLDGNDKLDCPNNAVTDFGTGDVTICALVKVPDTLSSTNTLLSTRSSGVGLQFGVRSSGAPLFIIEDSSGSTTSTDDGGDLSGRWCHMAVVVDRSGTATRLVDGVAVGTADSVSARALTITNANGLRIGHNNSDFYWNDGAIADLKVFTSALTVAQVLEMSKNGNQATPLGLTPVVDFRGENVQSDGDWLDASSNELNATSTGATPLYSKPQVSGTFTPVINFATDNTGVVHSVQAGRWNKISEKLVLVSIEVRLSALGSASGNISITGLPFTSVSTGHNPGSVAVLGDHLTGLTGALCGLVLDNSTALNIYQSSSTGVSILTHAAMTNTAYFDLQFVYEIA